jgi:hypothetical protein
LSILGAICVFILAFAFLAVPATSSVVGPPVAYTAAEQLALLPSGPMRPPFV